MIEFLLEKFNYLLWEIYTSFCANGYTFGWIFHFSNDSRNYLFSIIFMHEIYRIANLIPTQVLINDRINSICWLWNLYKTR